VPGARNIDISKLFTSENTDAILLGGFYLWSFYIMILSILLAVFRYALVADNLRPLESMMASILFFKKNKRDVFLLFLLISIVYIIIDQIMGFTIINAIWGFIYLFVLFIVIPPLTTIWWVRLYMARTGKKFYFDDLLAHPNELIELKLNQ
jgi:hypothetical protein